MKRKNRGQGMTEYLIIVAVIAVATIGIASVTSNHIKVGFGRISGALEGKKAAKDKFESYDDDSLLEGKDMGDFTDNVDRNKGGG